MQIRMTINGEERSCACDGMLPLIDILRDELHLTGAKPVCREGFCGACMVLVDGEPTLSCLVPGSAPATASTTPSRSSGTRTRAAPQ